ncbi:MAG: hypothetical protein RIC19_01340 [Phaeodactylibacter sp.]|uniref:hypothetical protein n=1 Tax=Phaeodactylibacter sp. TaxID=1940289 RepID=UPI0032EF35E6
MNNTVFRNIIRFVVLVALQGLFLKRVSDGWVSGSLYINIFLYPLFIMLLPLQTPRTGVLLLSFLMGISVDLFYDSLGVHAAALTAMGFARGLFLSLYEPREGYKLNANPTPGDLGMNWFLKYSASMLGLHLLVYFSVDAFSPIYVLGILTRTFFTFISTMVAILIFVFIFNPRR